MSRLTHMMSCKNEDVASTSLPVDLRVENFNGCFGMLRLQGVSAAVQILAMWPGTKNDKNQLPMNGTGGELQAELSADRLTCDMCFVSLVQGQAS